MAVVVVEGPYKRTGTTLFFVYQRRWSAKQSAFNTQFLLQLGLIPLLRRSLHFRIQPAMGANLSKALGTPPLPSLSAPQSHL